MYMRSRGDDFSLVGGVHQQVRVREVGQIRHAEEIACQVLALGQLSFVNIQNLLQLSHLLVHDGFITLQPEHRTEYNLEDNTGHGRVVVL